MSSHKYVSVIVWLQDSPLHEIDTWEHPAVALPHVGDNVWCQDEESEGIDWKGSFRVIRREWNQDMLHLYVEPWDNNARDAEAWLAKQRSAKASASVKP